MTTMAVPSAAILQSASALLHQTSKTSRKPYTPPLSFTPPSCSSLPHDSISTHKSPPQRTAPRHSWPRNQHNCTRAVQKDAANASTGTADTAEAERVRVKQELLSLMEASDGTLTPACLDLVTTLQRLNPNPEARSVPALALGYFETVKSTLQGKASPGAGLFASTFTLGRASFNAFKPAELEVVLQQTYNHVGQRAPDEYLLASPISIRSPDAAVPPLEGLLLNEARFAFSGPNAMEVVFVASVLRPARPHDEAELRRWRAVFAEHNPGMDERGFMTVRLPGAKGLVDHLYLDEELRIVKGNMGNTAVLRRIAAPAIPV